MYDRTFLDSKLGHAALASIAAMIAMIALSSQITALQSPAASLAYDTAIVGVA
jgi:hypothetical protein